MNMLVLRKSRKKPSPGDIFTYLMPDQLYRFGRVIRTDAQVGGFGDCLLIYLYSAESENATSIPTLRKEELLFPPLATDRHVWVWGYFQTVEQRCLVDDDVWPVHCFYDDTRTFELYKDEYGKRLPRRSEPCGDTGLCGAGFIDARVSMALGFLCSPSHPRSFVGKERSVYKTRLAEGLANGLSDEAAQLEAQKAVVRYGGERAEKYVWPGMENKRSKQRVTVIKAGPRMPSEERANLRIRAELRELPNMRRPCPQQYGFLWSPPDVSNLSGNSYYAHQIFLTDALAEGMPKDEAEFKALQTLVLWWGESIEDYDWSGVFPLGAKPKRKKK